MNDKAFDEAVFMELQGKVLGDVSGAIGLLIAYIGDQAGVYKKNHCKTGTRLGGLVSFVISFTILSSFKKQTSPRC